MPQRGKIQGASHANVRSGPDVIHPSIAILQEGQEVTIEGREGAWILVSLPDETEGYVHGTLIRPVSPTQREEAVARPPRVAAPEPEPEVKVERKEVEVEPVEAIKPVESIEPAEPREPKEPEGQSEPPAPSVEQASQEVDDSLAVSLAQVLKRMNWDRITWLVVSLCIFILGWILGGNYYRRRDRFKRTRLQF